MNDHLSYRFRVRVISKAFPLASPPTHTLQLDASSCSTSAMLMPRAAPACEHLGAHHNRNVRLGPCMLKVVVGSPNTTNNRLTQLTNKTTPSHVHTSPRASPLPVMAHSGAMTNAVLPAPLLSDPGPSSLRPHTTLQKTRAADAQPCTHTTQRQHMHTASAPL